MIKELLAKRYLKKKIMEIRNRKYPLYVIPELCDEDINVYDGILIAECKDKREFNYLKNWYKPPVSGYAPRFGVISYKDMRIIKDFRTGKYLNSLKEISEIIKEKEY